MENRPAYLRGRGRGTASQSQDRVIPNGRGFPPSLTNSSSGSFGRPGNNVKSNNLSNNYNRPETSTTTTGSSNNTNYSNLFKANKNNNRNNPIRDNLPPHNVRNDASHPNNTASSRSTSEKMSEQSEKSGEEIFKAAAAAHREGAKRHLLTSEAASFSDDDDDEDGEDFDKKRDSVFLSLLSKLNHSAACDGSEIVGQDDLGRTASYISDTLKTKAHICLICIETVRHPDPVWNCAVCYTMFHIQCIQTWIKEGVKKNSVLSTQLFPKVEPPWFCPKCRGEYQKSDFPKVYLCFCGKEENPAFDMWLVPHSCGQTCGKQLVPSCGHSCLLLCHPGPCPPCPKTTKSKCFCGRAPLQMRRCGTSKWSCGRRCEKPLNCGQHFCPLSCHEGHCGDCPELSEHYCMCRRKLAVVPCANPRWKCDEVCKKNLSCGHHKCQVICHSGDCPPCPKNGPRACPCGKSKFELPCTDEVPTCLETCGKLLNCDLHSCINRCHQGPCGTCREMTRKKCRCGKREKDLQCFKEFQCDIKCPNLKDCGVHQCKRKCCDGNCPPCTAMCGKPLTCRQHKCPNTCHTGPCYPCTAVATLRCNCGKTSKTVPCGAEKRTRPPRCGHPCLNLPDCHHPARIPHPCHFGECPRCNQICNKTLTGCSHSCPAPCHSAVKVKVKDTQPKVGPWEVKRDAERIEVVSKPCPQCLVPVPVTCYGKHETVMVQCYDAKVSSCQKLCGRFLLCSNHTCSLPCHTVEGAKGDGNLAGANCKSCEEPCSKPRPPGCSHNCLLICHPGPCPPCSQMIKMRCHCQMIVKHLACSDWTVAGGGQGGVKDEASPVAKMSKRDQMKSCGSRCPKTLPCAHQCKFTCHPEKCPVALDCSEKVKVHCPCGRRKQEFPCHMVQEGGAKVDCNKACEAEKERVRKEEEAEEKGRTEAEVLKRREELEEFERRSKGKKRKQRKQSIDHDNTNKAFFARNVTVVVMSVLVVIFAVFLYKLLFNM